MSAHRWARALVTGASGGIGDALARQLAAGGANLVVVARRGDQLDALAAELKQAHGVDVEVLAADLADDQQRVDVETRLAATDRPVDLLVNNAGFGTYGPFVDLPVDEEERQIRLNVLALVRLTSAAVRAMVPRGTGAVMNVSSLASLQPMPRNATYGATKAFVTSFTEALHEELRGTGVTATAVLPGFTRTGFQQTAGADNATSNLPGFAWMSAEDVAARALAATARGQAICITGAVNKVVAGLSGPVPRRVKRRVAGLITGRL